MKPKTNAFHLDNQTLVSYTSGPIREGAKYAVALNGERIGEVHRTTPPGHLDDPKWGTAWGWQGQFDHYGEFWTAGSDKSLTEVVEAFARRHLELQELDEFNDEVVRAFGLDTETGRLQSQIAAKQLELEALEDKLEEAREREAEARLRERRERNKREGKDEYLVISTEGWVSEKLGKGAGSALTFKVVWATSPNDIPLGYNEIAVRREHVITSRNFDIRVIDPETGEAELA